MRDYWATHGQGPRKRRVQQPQPVQPPQPKAALPTPVIDLAELRAELRPKPRADPDGYLPVASGVKQAPLPIPTTTNYQREATEHELTMLEHGRCIVRQLVQASFALDVITSGWWAMNRSAA